MQFLQQIHFYVDFLYSFLIIIWATYFFNKWNIYQKQIRVKNRSHRKKKIKLTQKNE
jgi:hypothetical protein